MIQVQATSGNNYDFFFFNADGQVWNGVSAWVTWVDGNYQNYRMAAGETSPPGTFRILSWPNGATRWQFRLRDATLSGSTLIASGELVEPVPYRLLERPTRIAGQDSSQTVGGSLTGGDPSDVGRTFIQLRPNSMVARQRANVTRVVMKAFPSLVAPGRIKFLVFRDGVRVDETDMFTVPHTNTGGQQIVFDLPRPLRFEKGDHFGIFHATTNAGDTTLATRATTGGNIRWASGDLLTQAELTSNQTGFAFSIEFFATGADVVYTGDSIMEGVNGSSIYRGHFQEDLAYGGEQSSEIPWWVNRFARESRTYQNLALGSQNLNWVRTVGVPQGLLCKPKAMVIHCGINDINGSRTLSAYENDLDAIRLLVPRKTHLIIDEILPQTSGVSNAETIRTWNAFLREWCPANNATLVRCYQVFQDPENPDDLLPAYDQDGIHLTTEGVMMLGRMIANAIDGQSELTAIENSTVIAREKSVINVQALL